MHPKRDRLGLDDRRYVGRLRLRRSSGDIGTLRRNRCVDLIRDRGRVDADELRVIADKTAGIDRGPEARPILRVHGGDELRTDIQLTRRLRGGHLALFARCTELLT